MRHKCGQFGNIRELSVHNCGSLANSYGDCGHNYGELATVVDGKFIIVKFPSTIVERTSTTMASFPQS